MAKLNDANIIFNTQPSNFFGNPYLDASLLGNGRVGIALTGAFANERILVNHADLKAGGYTGVLQDVSDKFANVRKLYADGKIFDAEKLLETEFKKKNCNPRPDIQIPLCQIKLDFLNQGKISEYKRMTNMESAEVLVTYNADATKIERSAFVGRTTDIIAYNIYKNGLQKINLNISVAHLIDDSSNEAKGKSLITCKYEGGYIYFAAKEKANDYGLVARIIVNGGIPANTENGIVIKDADEITILAKPFVGGNKETQFKALKTELQNIKYTYSKLQNANEAIHKRLFNEVSLSIKSSEKTLEDFQDMAMLVNQSHKSIIPEYLIVKAWNFAKYLTICMGKSLSTGGLWVSQSNMKSLVSFDNTAQLIYNTLVNSIDPDNLLDFFGFFEKYSADLKKNAARVYGTLGYVIPNNTSPDSALFGSVDSATLHFIASSALAANLFYTHYLVTGDVKTLKSRIFPFMKEVFNFYSDFLKLDNNGFYSTIPSYSPHSIPGNTIMGKPLENFRFTTNSTVDFLAFSALLENLLHASEVLGAKKDDLIWQEMKKKLPPYSVNEKGEIKEYTNSAFIDGVMNRGNLHCYGLYPLKNFSFSDQNLPYKPAVATTQDNVISLRQASQNAITARIKNASSVQDAKTLAMYSIQLAHSGNIEATRESLIRLLSSCFTASGVCLTNDWRGSGYTNSENPSIDIAGNLGFATAVTECIIQSDKKTLRILPIILPEFGSGEVNGIATDFAAKINLSWDMKSGRVILKIFPKISVNIDIQLNHNFKKLKSKEYKLGENNTVFNVQLVVGKTFTLEIG
ncbi:MAG: glycoside hydrolase family 95 protein [Firmicutes bacterium]|nr:glycoside hydrolase family 95 protein [Bacillota bacterium]